jgi:uncharacterized membrane protein HdeD (DUF308 family)
MFNKNVGRTEGRVRIILGVILLALPPMFLFPVWATVLCYVVGLVALITGVLGYCPAWQLFGMNTCRRNTSTPTGTSTPEG